MARSSTCIKLLIIAYHISKYFTTMPGTILNTKKERIANSTFSTKFFINQSVEYLSPRNQVLRTIVWLSTGRSRYRGTQACKRQ